MTSVFHTFRETARQHGGRPFLHIVPATAEAYGIAPGSLSYGDALAQVEAFRASYAAAGYGAGHRVGLLLENRPEMFLHWLALNGLGVSVVPINGDLRAAELEYLVGHSEMVLAVAVPGRREALTEAGRRAGRPLALFEPAREASPPAPAVPALVRDIEPDEASECALLYTSGTTGRPKGCILPNEYFLAAGRWYHRIGGMCSLRPGEERLITPLPMTHMNAMAYSTMAMIISGGCCVPLDRFHPKSWWQSVRDSEATIVHYLGVMPAMLMSAQATPADRDHRVRFGFGAGVAAQNHAAFEARFGFPLLEAWAMTETGAGAVIIANHEPRQVGTACFGKAEPDVEWRIVDDAGGDAAVGMQGELWVRHRGTDPTFGFFKGYLKDEEATRSAWADGYFHTGDVVRIDEGGSFHFVDRKKNVIRRSGENIAAVEVESVLLQHPAVKSVAVAATPDPVRGDEVLACIVPAEGGAGNAALAAEIVTWCLDELAYFKVPGYVAFMDELPLTATSKIQRGQLKDLAARLPGSGQCHDTRHLKTRHA